MNHVIITNTGPTSIRVRHRSARDGRVFHDYCTVKPGEELLCDPVYISFPNSGRIRFTVEPEEEHKRIFEGALASS